MRASVNLFFLFLFFYYVLPDIRFASSVIIFFYVKEDKCLKDEKNCDDPGKLFTRLIFFSSVSGFVFFVDIFFFFRT